eukprot:2426640-Pyramimonas_sp.AAC.1
MAISCRGRLSWRRGRGLKDATGSSWHTRLGHARTTRVTGSAVASAGESFSTPPAGFEAFLKIEWTIELTGFCASATRDTRAKGRSNPLTAR